MKFVRIFKKNKPIPMNVGNLYNMLNSKSKSIRRYAKRRIKILEAYNHSCIKCGSQENLTFDHFMPARRTNGGKRKENDYKISNCQVLCVECHYKKDYWGRVWFSFKNLYLRKNERRN